MNEKKVCFIFCSNDQLYTEECLHYINHLNIPEGYEVDALAIEGAVSMTAGYNEGMQASLIRISYRILSIFSGRMHGLA